MKSNGLSWKALEGDEALRTITIVRLIIEGPCRHYKARR